MPAPVSSTRTCFRGHDGEGRSEPIVMAMTCGELRTTCQDLETTCGVEKVRKSIHARQ